MIIPPDNALNNKSNLVESDIQEYIKAFYLSLSGYFNNRKNLCHEINFPVSGSLPMAKILWFMAIIITLSSAIYQRMTGPTYPIRGNIKLENTEISFKLLRSETTDQGAPIRLMIPDTSITGYVKYKRYRSHDQWSQMPLLRSGDTLQAFLPKQPAAGKIMYFVYLNRKEVSLSLTKQEPVVLRYKGAVPAAVLIPHVFIMFLCHAFFKPYSPGSVRLYGPPEEGS